MSRTGLDIGRICPAQMGNGQDMSGTNGNHDGAGSRNNAVLLEVGADAASMEGLSQVGWSNLTCTRKPKCCVVETQRVGSRNPRREGPPRASASARASIRYRASTPSACGSKLSL